MNQPHVKINSEIMALVVLFAVIAYLIFRK